MLPSGGLGGAVASRHETAAGCACLPPSPPPGGAGWPPAAVDQLSPRPSSDSKQETSSCQKKTPLRAGQFTKQWTRTLSKRVCVPLKPSMVGNCASKTSGVTVSVAGKSARVPVPPLYILTIAIDLRAFAYIIYRCQNLARIKSPCETTHYFYPFSCGSLRH